VDPDSNRADYFGFKIYQFFQLELPGRAEKSRLLGPREFALILVGLGLVSLVLATRCCRLDRPVPVRAPADQRHDRVSPWLAP
jgi:hypothetical protein